jgi:excisionase family DNA binding protein
MPALEESPAANNVFISLDATRTWSTVRPEEASRVKPIQQSLDLDALRVDGSRANPGRTSTRKKRADKTSPVADKRRKTSGAWKDDIPLAGRPQRVGGREVEEKPAGPSSASSVPQIPASPLPSSASATGSDNVFPSRAPRRADVRLAERVALSVEEAGALLGISRDLAYDLVGRGQLPSVRLGRRLVVPRRALEGALDRLSEPGQ